MTKNEIVTHLSKKLGTTKKLLSQFIDEYLQLTKKQSGDRPRYSTNEKDVAYRPKRVKKEKVEYNDLNESEVIIAAIEQIKKLRSDISQIRLDINNTIDKLDQR
ncbi:MAG: hypothetical protein PVH88_14345 [Ignavibacteria bacterium]|jgi:hypothetical protein